MKYLAKDNGKTIPMVEIRKNVLKRQERISVERHCRFYVHSLLTLHF